MLDAMGGGGADNPGRSVGTRARRAGSKRRAGGWLLIALALAVACLFVSSRWWALYWRRGSLAVGAASGIAFVADVEGNERERHVTSISPQYRGLRWVTGEAPSPYLQVDFNARLLMRCRTRLSVEWSFALWPLVLVFGGAGAWLVRSGVVARRRAAVGSCGGCGYSLTGLERGAPCPECGKVEGAPA